MDNLWEKCTWDFEFIVPRSLEQQDALSEDEDDAGVEAEVEEVGQRLRKGKGKGE